MMAAEFAAGFSYRYFIKPFLFSKDPERIHDFTISLGEKLGRNVATRFLIDSFLNYQHPKLRQRLLGMNFSNPLGLAAGFDKNGRLTQILPILGFGFEEIGSITFEPSAGNPRPRLDRLPKSQGLVVNYGLCNLGADTILSGLSSLKFRFPLGISIAKTNSPKTVVSKDGIADYASCLEKVLRSGVGDYVTINISCPNAYGGETFTTPGNLNDLLTVLLSMPGGKPIFVKMPLDIGKQELDELLQICKKQGVKGVVISNLTKNRSSKFIDQEEIKKVISRGGISGKPTFEKSNELIKFAYQNYGKDFVIIGCGGVFTAEDAYHKIKLGASLIQLITGLVFRGPQLACEINRGLARFLERDGLSNISDAVGVDCKI